MLKKLPTDLSRIDKLRLDRDSLAPEESRAQRSASVPCIAAGADCASSEALQVMLLTAVNLAFKSFSAPVPLDAPDSVWAAACLTALGAKPTLGEALQDVGAVRAQAGQVPALTLLVGDARARRRALRMTFDGWRVGVGPSDALPRMQERPYCVLAPLAAAAVGVGEAFSAWANISIEAARKNLTFSLWRPDVPVAEEASLGQSVSEFPSKLELFGLGHLGQAYIWGMAALPLEDRRAVMPYLCDDDGVELPNLETGALLGPADLDGRKTRALSDWLSARGFDCRLVERFIGAGYRRCASEPGIALSGFDNNEARQWLADAGFDFVFDSGLGGESTNFDSIAVRTWPHAKPAAELWPMEDEAARAARAARKRERTKSNAAYQDIAGDECGRLLVADKSVAVHRGASIQLRSSLSRSVICG